MRILVISNLYPPFHVGGYELGCQDVVKGLKDREHIVKVLTSTYGIQRRCDDGEAYRWMEADLGWTTHSPVQHTLRLGRKEVTNLRAFRLLCSEFEPDVLFAWNLTHISISVIYAAQRMGIPVCYFVSDNWLSRWETDAWYALEHQPPRLRHHRYLVKVLRWISRVSGLSLPADFLDLSDVVFASRYLKDYALERGRSVAGAKVIHWGVDLDRFAMRNTSNNPTRLLYVGQLVKHKGVHTAIEALRVLVHRYKLESASLTIVGGTLFPEYETHLRQLISFYGLEPNAAFTGPIRRESLPSIYQKHDILIFPSIWDEPFSITLLEAMSSGLAVVGTATGGSSEILEHEVNSLVFPKEDARACATQILRIMGNRQLFETIRQNGRRTVEQRFMLESTIQRIEDSLLDALL